MTDTIDCLFIGHNETTFEEYENNLREMGLNSGAYRDLSLSYIQYLNKPYTAPEIFNLFYCNDDDANETRYPMTIGETFNAAAAYLGSYLNRRGYRFDFVNAFQDQKEELERKLKENNILTIGIITTLYVSALPVIEIIEFIKKHNASAKIIVGGPFVSNQIRVLEETDAEHFFENIGADFYVDSSQGEATLVSIIHSLKNNLPMERVNNIHFESQGTIVKTQIQKEDNKLSENMVDWSLFDGKLDRFVNVRTSISCPFSCSFCGFPEHAGAYQTADVDCIEQELDRLAAVGTVQSVQFIDDTFNIPVKRFKEILRMMIRKKYNFRWHSHFRCQFADRETIELMKESGCEGVFLGIESGSDEILKNMNKAATVEKYLEGVRLLKEYGILTYGSFIIGFPGETRDTVAESVKFIKESGMDFFRVQLWYCDTVTPIWKEREKYNIQGSRFEWSHDTMDSKTACDIVEEIFLTIDEPIWVPQYNFEFNGIFHLLQRGFSPEMIKNFLKGFNRAIREKLNKPSSREASMESIIQIKESIQTGEQEVEPQSQQDEDAFEDAFDF